MKRNYYLSLLAAAVLGSLAFAGCGNTGTENENVRIKSVSEQKSAAEKISAEDARLIMNSGEEYFLLDVRTQEEYDAQHIPGAVCIPDTELTARRDELPESTDMRILVYCRSGRRSAASADVLTGLGYSSVYDFGGIIDWPFETETTADVTPQTDAASEQHVHEWVDFDCNYQQCSSCGKQKRYSDPA